MTKDLELFQLSVSIIFIHITYLRTSALFLIVTLALIHLELFEALVSRTASTQHSDNVSVDLFYPNKHLLVSHI